MSSVTNTFRCVLPLWTIKVRPTNSGTSVQARAHVLIGSFEPVCWEAWTFLYTLKSTKGPFFLDRLIFVSCGAGILPAVAFMAGWKPAPRCYTSLITPYLRDLRRRTIALFDALPRVRVRPPLAGTPVGLTGCRPPLVRPSPPPCG